MTAAEQRAADLARYYDLDLVSDPGDLDLYLALAARTEGPILELAAGTGRLAVPLAASGRSVTALDSDPAMLARAAARWRDLQPSAEPGSDLQLVEDDLLHADLGPRFGLTILALNSLFLFAEPGDQAAVVTALARHLRPGGWAVVDVWLPGPEDLVRYDGHLELEWQRDDPETGERVAKLVSARYEPGDGVAELTTWFEAWPPQGGPLRRVAREDRLRLVAAADLGRWAAEAGLEVETLAGDYELHPFGPGAERAVLIARREDG